jgi:hypothetical protein
VALSILHLSVCLWARGMAIGLDTGWHLPRSRSVATWDEHRFESLKKGVLIQKTVRAMDETSMIPDLYTSTDQKIRYEAYRWETEFFSIEKLDCSRRMEVGILLFSAQPLDSYEFRW